MIPSRILFKDSTVYAIIIPSLIALVILIAALSSFYYIIVSYAQTLSATTFPRPIFYQLRNEPSYAITIPFSSSGNSTFDPPDVSIPLRMTIIWNDDTLQIPNNFYILL